MKAVLILLIGILILISACTLPKTEKECVLSLCDCKCYEKGQTPEEKDGNLCGINCLAEYGVSGCEFENEKCIETHEVVQQEECNSDTECFVGGCSGQVCSNQEGVITTCEWLEKYKCYSLSTCKCINNKCEWETNEDFTACLEEVERGV